MDRTFEGVECVRFACHRNCERLVVAVPAHFALRHGFLVLKVLHARLRISGHSSIVRQMCGRSSLHDAPVALLERFKLPPVLPGFKPRYNIAPTQEQWTLGINGDRNPEVRARRWGLIPSWANDPAIGNRMINARAESLSEKPAFKDALERRRCLVLADGYYEWTGSGRSKRPMFFHFPGDTAFAMAGLWELWDRGDAPLETCTVITTDANQLTARFHPRMPVLLSEDSAAWWLDPSTPTSSALSLLRPYEGGDLECYEVSKLVNNASFDSPACMEPASESSDPGVSQLSLLPD